MFRTYFRTRTPEVPILKIFKSAKSLKAFLVKFCFNFKYFCNTATISSKFTFAVVGISAAGYTLKPPYLY
jgi:hypothetical protein